MIYARVPIGKRVLTVRGKDFRELKERIVELQKQPQKPVTSIVTRSGERVELSKQESN